MAASGALLTLLLASCAASKVESTPNPTKRIAGGAPGVAFHIAQEADHHEGLGAVDEVPDRADLRRADR